MGGERKLLEDCFSKPDHEFASMPAQIDATLDWVKHLRDRQVGWREAKGQIEAYLERQGVKKGHARRQVERAKALVRPWLV